MDEVEKIHKAMEKILASIGTAGFDKLDVSIIDELDKISANAKALGMEQGKKLAENLSAVLKSFKEGKTAADSVSVRLTALDFYLKNTQGGTSTEEL